MKKNLFLILIIILISSSCDQEEEIRPEWPFEFVFVKNGDSDISTVTLNTSISYPIEYETILQGTIKSISKENEFFLRQFDTLYQFEYKMSYK